MISLWIWEIVTAYFPVRLLWKALNYLLDNGNNFSALARFEVTPNTQAESRCLKKTIILWDQIKPRTTAIFSSRKQMYGDGHGNRPKFSLLKFPDFHMKNSRLYKQAGARYREYRKLVEWNWNTKSLREIFMTCMTDWQKLSNDFPPWLFKLGKLLV